jgi:hypothetical protein
MCLAYVVCDDGSDHSLHQHRGGSGLACFHWCRCDDDFEKTLTKRQIQSLGIASHRQTQCCSASKCSVRSSANVGHIHVREDTVGQALND